VEVRLTDLGFEPELLKQRGNTTFLKATGSDAG